MPSLTRFRHAILVSLVLLWALGASLYLAKHDAPTTDEAPHLASAYTAAVRHDYRFEPEHPFLYKTIAILPVLLLHPNLPQDDQRYWQAAAPSFYDSWRELRSWASQWLYQSGNDSDEMFFLARLTTVACFVLLCWSVYFVGKRWFSPAVGLWALLFTAFNPTLLAHGHLVTTDIPVALAFVWALYTAWQYGERPGFPAPAWLGLALAAALLTKFSALTLLPVIVLYVIYRFWQKRPQARLIAAHTVTALAVIWIAIWSIYGWHSPYVPGTPLAPASVERLEKHGISRTTLGSIGSRILPMSYVTGLSLIADDTQDGRGSYLLGKVELGAWYYFPVVYLLKTPLTLIALNLFGFYLLLRRRDSASRLLGIVIIVYAVSALISKLHLGVRHLIPPIALSGLLSALAIQAISSAKKTGPSWLAPALVALLAAGPVIAQFPYLLNFTNVFVYPKAQAYRYFDDSNLDWGQDVNQVADLVRNRFAGKTIYFNPIWSGEAPGYYGMKIHSFNPANPPHEGIAVIAATTLASDAAYARFRTLTPAAAVSNTTFIYLLQ